MLEYLNGEELVHGAIGNGRPRLVNEARFQNWTRRSDERRHGVRRAVVVVDRKQGIVRRA